MFVEVTDVAREFATSDGPVRALDGVPFGVRAGEFLSIVGPSGCGKSTLAMLIAGLMRPSAGPSPSGCAWSIGGRRTAFLISFFPIIIDTVIGLRSVEPEMISLARSMGAGEGKIFMKIRFPSALPNMFAGLKVAVTLEVVGAIVGEFVRASSRAWAEAARNPDEAARLLVEMFPKAGTSS